MSLIELDPKPKILDLSSSKLQNTIVNAYITFVFLFLSTISAKTSSMAVRILVLICKDWP